jgi:hypothetical protein
MRGHAGLRILEPENENNTHQLQGTDGSLASSEILREIPGQQTRPGLERQYNSSSHDKSFGRQSSELSELSQALWIETYERNIMLSAKHLSGRINVEADFLSRLPMSPYQWKLHPRLFDQLDR